MKNNNQYRISGEDYNTRIHKVAEKLWEDRDILHGSVLSWEKFTKDYMKYPLPKTDLESIYWARYRSTWAQEVMMCLWDCGYDAALIIKPNKGVEMFTGREAVRKIRIRMIKKIVTGLLNGAESCRLYKRGFCTSNFPRQADQDAEMLIENVHSLYARIDLAKNYTKEHKEELKDMIKKKLESLDRDAPANEISIIHPSRNKDVGKKLNQVAA